MMLFPSKLRLLQGWSKIQFLVNDPLSISSSSKWSQRQAIIAWISLLIVSLCVLAPNLSYPLMEPDETRYAEIAIEMNASLDWINPTLDGQAYLDKPPLMYWMTALSFHLFGVHETAARLPAVLSAILTILASFALGSRIVGQRAAWLGALSLALCGGFILAGRFLILDALLTLFTTIGLLAGYIAQRQTDHQRWWWAISGLACALGVLTKGPIALVLCVPPLIINRWLLNDRSSVSALNWIVFALPTVFICVPWYLAVMWFNPSFVDHFFWEHNFQRFTQGANHQQPFWFYVPIIFAGMFPTSLLLPSLGWFLVTRNNATRLRRSKDLGFLFCASAWIVVFFSIASCKLPTYVLPAVPFLALMIGVLIEQTVLRTESTGAISTHLLPFPRRASLILTFTGVAIVGVIMGLQGISSFACLLLFLFLLLTLVTVIYWKSAIATRRSAWLATYGLACFVLTIASAELLPAIGNARSLYSKVKTVSLHHPDAMIVFYGRNVHGVEMQLNRHQVTYFPRSERAEFISFIGRLPYAIVVADRNDVSQISPEMSSTHRLIALPEHKRLYVAQRKATELASERTATRDPAEHR